MAVRVVHSAVPGRLRIELPDIFRRRELEQPVYQRLAALGPVRSVRVSALTGRVLVSFDETLAHADIVRAICEALDSGLVPDGGRSQGRAMPPDAKGTGRARKAGARPPSAGATGPAWHALSISEVLQRVESRPGVGLTGADVAARLRSDGPNLIPERPPTSAAELLFRQVASLPVAMLFGAAAVSVLTGGVADAVVTLAVVGANAAIGYASEKGSERVIRRMTRPQTYRVRVIRDGIEQVVDHDQVVRGDILVLRPNVVIAADARVIASDGLQTNEALLTGESDPAAKDTSACALSEPLSERRCMVYKDSFVASGTGLAVVVASGARTETGRIEQTGQEVAPPRTPLERDLENLGEKLGVISLAACGLFLAGGYLRGRPMRGMFKSAIALAVAAVPEGLPTTATTTLALGLRRLRRNDVIVRRLEAVEALGSLQVICFDKTGTLTPNEMELAMLSLGEAEPGAREWEGGGASTDDARLKRLFEIAVLCSEVEISEQHSASDMTGSATELALVRGALESGCDVAALRGRWPLNRMTYRTDCERYMTSLHGRGGLDGEFLAVKGDPEQVLAKCRFLLNEAGHTVALDDQMISQIRAANDSMAGRGLRVLGFACAHRAQALEKDALIWVGAAGLKAPLMPGARSLIRTLKRAGIRPVMITGDQSATAESIARDIGLTDGPVRVLDAAALETLSLDVLSAIVRQTDVFARVAPARKYQIVKALQDSGLTVGMTGDGFNDALALKAADIAIAVGRESASAARDVADIIIARDDLSVIADGISQGRTILSNIRKSVHFMISTNLSEIIVVIAESLKTGDVIESPLELLWVNLVTDILPSLGLALEPAERNVMDQPPRDASEPLLRARDLRISLEESGVIAGATLAAHGYGLMRYGPGLHTRSVTFLSLVTAQLLHALTCRHDRFEALGGRSLFGNPVLNAALAGSFAIQALPLISPGMARLLGIAPPRLGDLAVAGLAGVAAFGINETALAWRNNAMGNRKTKLLDDRAPV